MTGDLMIGLDEVGRGCFAGPLVVGAVQLTENIEGLKDSKKLSAKRRSELDAVIRARAGAIGLAWIPPSRIDEVGLAKSLEEAFIGAFLQISKRTSDKVIVDGNINYLETLCKSSQAMPKADDSIEAVMAASIIAKQARDDYMIKQHAVYPQYAFDKNMGYGTLKHRLAIKQHGVCSLHRLSLKPLREYADERTAS